MKKEKKNLKMVFDLDNLTVNDLYQLAEMDKEEAAEREEWMYWSRLFYKAIAIMLGLAVIIATIGLLISKPQSSYTQTQICNTHYQSVPSFSKVVFTTNLEDEINNKHIDLCDVYIKEYEDNDDVEFVEGDYSEKGTAKHLKVIDVNKITLVSGTEFNQYIIDYVE